VPLSVDHKPNREDERDRIESDGGVVAWAGTWRVSGVLAVSRSFGNRQMKTWVISRPDVAQRTLGPRHSALVIATDGVWDVVGNDEAAALVSKHSSAEAAARALVIGAYERGSMDNISAVVVLLRLPEAAAAAEVATETAPAGA
jgi:protein phosphatase 1L